MESKTPRSTDEKVARRRKHRKRRLIVYGSLLLLIYGFWIWQPYELDIIPRTPSPNPPVDPDSTHLFSPGTKVLVVTAHPDDSAFYIGGFLTRLGRSGAEVHQIICTDGDKAYYGPFAEPESIRNRRRAEALEELHTWGGKDVLFLGRPDGRLRADDALVRRIRQRIDEIQPEYVICFDGDYPPRLSHQDHRRSGEAAEEAVKGAPSVRWLMKFSTHAPNWVCDIDDYWEDQKKLLMIHSSQFHDERLERVTNMVESLAVQDGERIKATYGEGFRCIRLK
ncbi:MAG: PIG-L deacetylase family protein [Fimbriimonadales bacterium]